MLQIVDFVPQMISEDKVNMELRILDYEFDWRSY